MRALCIKVAPATPDARPNAHGMGEGPDARFPRAVVHWHRTHSLRALRGDEKGTMPRLLVYTIAAVAFLALKLPRITVAVKAGNGLILVHGVAAVGAHALLARTGTMIGKLHDR